MRVTGVTGEVRWGYLAALVLGPWRYEGDREGGTIIAEVARCDEFRLTQTPLVVVVPVGRAVWRWSVRDLSRSGSSVTITAGPREQG